jgi:hypothetical protein
MRERTSTYSEVRYLLTDHLGSTSIVADTNGVKVAETRYKPWGEVRYTSGTSPTDYTYTGQRRDCAKHHFGCLLRSRR